MSRALALVILVAAAGCVTKNPTPTELACYSNLEMPVLRQDSAEVVGTRSVVTDACAPIARRTFVVRSRLTVDGEELANPTLVVYEGEQATVVIDGALSVSLIVDHRSNRSAFVTTDIRRAGARLEPSLLVNLGEPASVTIDDTNISLIVDEVGSVDEGDSSDA